jgi:hypothetical protein
MSDRGHQPGGNGITNAHEDNGDGGGDALGGKRELLVERTDDLDAALDQLRRLGHSGLGLAARETDLVHNVPALLTAEGLETGLEPLHRRNVGEVRPVEHADTERAPRGWLSERERRGAGQ